MKKQNICTVLKAAALAALSVVATCRPALAQSGGDYSLTWSTIDSGGGTSTGGVISVTGTIGQPDAGKLKGGCLVLDGGFWGITAPPQLPSPPYVVYPPTNQAAIVGQDIAMKVSAGGTLPLSYQWRFKGTNLAGATSTRLTLFNVQTSNDGSYTVVVADACGQTTTSSVAVLTVNADQAVITLWSFNSNPPDGNSTTGTLYPYHGSGYAWYTGGTGPSISGFRSGSPGDPAASDNTAWYTTSYPLPYMNNKMAGVQFYASTAGRQNIVIRWDQRISPTASKYWRLLFLTDWGYMEAPTTSAMQADSSWETKSMSIGSFPGVNNNPSFAFLIVAEFESTAIGSPNTFYVTPAGPFLKPYDPTGVASFDMVTVSGGPLSAPEVVTDPVSRAVWLGQGAVFSVSAEGFQPLRYQWWFNNTAMTGATNSTFTLTNAQPVNEGSYWVVVTNAAGCATSAVATLTVLLPAPAVLSEAACTMNLGFGFTITGTPGASYVIQTCTNLVGAIDWVPVLTNVSPFTFVDTNALYHSQRFYRARLWP